MDGWKDLFYKSYVSSGQSIHPDVTIKDLYRPYGKYFIEKFFPKDKNSFILDIGCGIGAFLYTAKQLGYYNVEGIDISAEQIAIANNLGLDYCRQENIFETIHNMPNNCKDIILLMDVLEHCTRDEIVTILQQIFRILKKGGILLIHVPNAEGIFGSKVRYSDFTHEIAFTSKSAHQVLSLVGFSVIKTFEDEPLKHSLLSTIRLILWRIATIPFRLLHLIETGTGSIHLSQNFLIYSQK